MDRTRHKSVDFKPLALADNDEDRRRMAKRSLRCVASLLGDSAAQSAVNPDDLSALLWLIHDQLPEDRPN